MNEHPIDYEEFFHSSIDLLCLASTEGYFIKVNPAVEKALGYTHEELLSKPFLDFIHPDDRQSTIKEVERLISGVNAVQFENRYQCKDGSYIWLSWMTPAPNPGSKYLYAVARDLTEMKKAQHELNQKNAALQEVLGQIEIEKQQIKEDVMSNIEELILPVLKKLKRKGNQLDQQYLDVMEKNLEQLTSSFGHKISSKKLNLTPKEIEICSMIKNGLSSKDMASALSTSLRTIENHRNHIRTKLGLSGKKVNLVSYLKSV